MCVLSRIFRTVLCIAVLFLAPNPAGAQDKQSAAGAGPVTFDGLVQILRTGQSEEDILKLLEQSPIDVSFVFGDSQRTTLKKMRVSDEFIDGVQKVLEKRQKTASSDVTDLVLILDCSGSMSEKAQDGKTKMEAAQKVVTELIGDFPTGRRLALIVYGHDASRECKAVDVVRPLSEFDQAARAQLQQYVSKLEPKGHTPISRALEAATGEVAQAKGLPRVVLITDGVETCHGDPVKAAADLVAKTKATVDVIGFSLKPEEAKAIDQIAKAGRGKFYDAQTAAKLRQDLRFVAQIAPQVEQKPAADDGKIPPVVQALIDQLGDEDADVRHSAAESLGKMGARAKGAVPALAKRLSDDLWGSGKNPVHTDNAQGNTSKDAALKALNQLAADKVEDALVDATKSKNPKTRLWAATQLAPKRAGASVAQQPTTQSGAGADGIVPKGVQALIQQLEDEDADVRHAAAESLAKTGARASGAVPALMKRLADDRWGSGRNPVHTDNASGNTSKDEALKALKQLAPDKVEDALVQATKSSNPKTRLWASGQLSTSNAVPSSKRQPTTKSDAAANGDVPPAVLALIEQLNDGDADVRHSAAESLSKLGSKANAAVPALMKRLADDRWGSGSNPVNTDNARGNTSKDAALKALRQIAPDKVEAALVEAMKSKSPKTKAWASAQIGNP
jgi:HEAT repeat protein/Mg-chelatase subunit ChlD